jgi:cardiolipin hydrolase
MKTFHFTTLFLLALICAKPIPVHAASPRTTATSVTAAFDDECEPLLLKAIKGAHKEIHVAIYTFARKSIAEALIERARVGVKISVKMDDKESEYEFTGQLIEELRKAKIKVARIKMKERGKMHHKFAVIDGATVVTGSFNWTRQAEVGNWENLVVIESPTLAAEYLAEWERIDNSR